jgi:chromosome segregation ATPase
MGNDGYVNDPTATTKEDYWWQSIKDLHAKLDLLTAAQTTELQSIQTNARTEREAVLSRIPGIVREVSAETREEMRKYVEDTRTNIEDRLKTCIESQDHAIDSLTENVQKLRDSVATLSDSVREFRLEQLRTRGDVDTFNTRLKKYVERPGVQAKRAVIAAAISIVGSLGVIIPLFASWIKNLSGGVPK